MVRQDKVIDKSVPDDGAFRSESIQCITEEDPKSFGVLIMFMMQLS